jgi:hypothetical protein
MVEKISEKPAIGYDSWQAFNARLCALITYGAEEHP